MPLSPSLLKTTLPERRAGAVAAYPPYADYQEKTDRQIPLFIASPKAKA